MTRYPIGIQTFSKLRENDYVYIDKTEYVYRLANTPRCYFLSRPRRFGKSMLLTTLKAYFEGRKELFKGLAIERLEKEWNTYPVLHFDFSSAEVDETAKFKTFIIQSINNFATSYGIGQIETGAGIGPMFGDLIDKIAAKTGRPVVILIDEYDKGLHEVLQNEQRLNENIDLLRPFFSQLKSRDRSIHFVMITGVARFRHLTLFSGVNNLTDISMNKDYSAICGITQQELIDNFSADIQLMADNCGSTFDGMLQSLKDAYDNYRFSESPVKVYNPVSLMNALEQQRISSYWLQTGTSMVFFNYLKQSRFQLSELEDLWVREDDLANAYSAENPVSLLYQTGYLTIIDYANGMYKLGIPNGEVRRSLIHQLIPNYLGISNYAYNSLSVKLGNKINSGDAEGMMEQLKAMTATIPYHQFGTENIESTYHLSIYLIFLMLGIDTRSEIAMSGGRIDMVALTKHYAYIFEFKINSSPAEALRQIDDRGYAIPWMVDGRKVIKIGVSFSSKTRAIDNWEIQREG